MKRNVRKGFTLIEVIMVVAIIAIIAAFVVPNIAGKMNKAKKNLAKAGISKLQTSLVEFQSDCNRYPYDDEGLESLLDYPDDLEEIWDGPYAKEKNLIDPWGNDFIYYEDEETEDGYVIVSMGPNGQEDDSEEGDDIISD
jgi:general secretion pathway protein G